MRFLLVYLVVLSHCTTLSADIRVYFSPDGGCTAAIIQALHAAKSEIRIQAYSFTSQPIAKALLDARRRGVRIYAILDKSNQTDKYSAATFLQNQGVLPLVDASHAIAHNKIMIIDAQVVITGSFNFTKAAEENNAENLLIIRDTGVAKQYLDNWQQHAVHSRRYERKGP